MSPLEIIVTLLQLYIYVIIIDVVLSWLINFQVINTSNQLVRQVHTFTFKATNPVYQKVRQVVPAFGGLDLSPLFVILGVQLAIWAVIKFLGPLLS